MKNITLIVMLAVSCFCLHWTFASQQQAQPAAVAQKGFASPKEAAVALVKAAESLDVSALLEILGPDGKDLVSSSDTVQDRKHVQEFATSAKEKMTVSKNPTTKDSYAVIVGKQEFPLAIPIVKREGKWYFDSKAGHDEILFRRIGTNELNAITVCRGFVEAQKQYASTIHDNSGIHQYAQKLISSPGKQDGLYWEDADGTPGGPVTKGVAKALQEGYSLDPNASYSGYFFRLLKGQGPDAPLGEMDYVIKGMMIGGFALVAVPAEYRVTGVKTFIVSYDGIVYEKDLGPNSLEIVKGMERYNPDKTWTPTDDSW